MKRPLIYITVGYITGIIWGLYLKISIVPIFLIFWGVIFIIRKKKVPMAIWIFIVFGIISNVQINYLEAKHESLYQGIENAKIIGTIISDRKETEYRASYTIKVENINNNTKFRGTNLLIYTKKENILNYGDKVLINGSYDKAKQATNYKAFDYREYLKGKNIYGIVNVDNVRVLQKDNLNKLQLGINRIQNKIKSNLKEILGEESSIAVGILLRRYF